MKKKTKPQPEDKYEQVLRDMNNPHYISEISFDEDEIEGEDINDEDIEDDTVIKGLNWDPWQLEVINTKGNIALCTGRQVGKSTVIAARAGEYAVKNKKKSILIISSTERQAEELFVKCLNYIYDNYKTYIKKGKDRPTKKVIKLNNGSIIRCLPTGLSGLGIRGFTVDKLIADEAAFIPDLVWQAVTPMLLTTGGDIELVSTPYGRQGYFYQCCNDPTFTVFHIDSETVIKEREISDTWNIFQREKAIEHLEREKSSMTKLRYAQEYLGQFVDKLLQLFPDELIQEVMKLKRPATFMPSTYVLGVDVARMGRDESTFEILDISDENDIRHIENLITNKTMLKDTTEKILELDNLYHFKNIYIDDGGIGVAVYEQLRLNDQTRRKTIPINNVSRPINKDKTRKKKMLKEDLYMNLQSLMENRKIELLDDAEVFQSLKSVQYSYTDKNELKIYGKYTHIVEGIIRAAWGVKETRKVWIY